MDDPSVSDVMMDPLTIVTIAFCAVYIAVALYGETQRKHSHFWRGYTDVTGWRIFGFNLDDDKH